MPGGIGLLMQDDRGGLGLVKEISGHRLAHVRAQLLPSIALGENIMRKALGYIAVVVFLRYAEDNSHGGDYRLKMGGKQVFSRTWRFTA